MKLLFEAFPVHLFRKFDEWMNLVDDTVQLGLKKILMREPRKW